MKRPLQEPLLTPRAKGKRRLLTKHDSVIEQYVASQPIRAKDLIYPTNIMVVDQTDQTGASYDPTPVLLTASEYVPTPSGTSVAGVSYPEQARIQLLLETLPAQRIAMLVTIAVFAGYAALFSLQHVIKVFFEIPDDNSEDSHYFSYAITVQYVSNLVFRLGHNALLAPFTPRQRCLFGLVAMGISMSILSLFIFSYAQKSLVLLAVAYAFGGCAVGVFETNYSVVLAALGNQTKIYGISGIPIGIFLVIVPGFIAVGMGMDVRFIYGSVLVLLAMGAVVLFRVIHYPDVDSLLSCDGEMSPREDPPDPLFFPHVPPQDGRRETMVRWMGPVVSVGLVFTLNMLCVACFSPGVLLYLLNGPFVDLTDSLSIRTGYFFAIFSSCGFVGDVISRRIVYQKRPSNHPVWYLLFTAAGAAIIVSRIALIAPIGTFLIFFANGSIYAQSCRKLDQDLDTSVSVLGNSLFFFLGDCGSVMGAFSIPFVRDLMT